MLNLAQGPNLRTLEVGKVDWLCLVPGMPACSSHVPCRFGRGGVNEN